jgi:hypothetical protein
MMRAKRLAAGAALLVAMALLVVPAIVLAGGNSGTAARTDKAKAGPATVTRPATVLQHHKCARRMERNADWPL